MNYYNRYSLLEEELKCNNVDLFMKSNCVSIVDSHIDNWNNVDSFHGM